MRASALFIDNDFVEDALIVDRFAPSQFKVE